MFRPAFRQLVSLIQERVKYPTGYEKWPKEDKADFKDMRYAVADTLCDAAREPPVRSMLKQMCSLLPQCFLGALYHCSL